MPASHTFVWGKFGIRGRRVPPIFFGISPEYSPLSKLYSTLNCYGDFCAAKRKRNVHTVITRSLRHPQSMRHPPIISINILISHNLLTSYEKMTHVKCVYKIWWRFMLFCESYCRNILKWGVSDRFPNLKNASYML